MIATAAELFEALRSRGAIPAEAAAPEDGRPLGRPWYISLMLGLAGWFAGVFLLIFVAILFKPDSGAIAWIIGPVLLAAAWGLYQADREGAFVTQLALSLSIAGQFALVFAFADTFFKQSHSIAGIAFPALILQAVLVAIMPNGLHRTMSALFACIAWAVFVRWGVWDQADAGSYLAKPVAPSLGYALVGWALSWLPVAGLLYLAIIKEPAWMAAGRSAIVRPATTGIVVALAAGTLISHPFESFTWIHSPAANIGWLALWPLLSAIAAVAALAGAFALGSKGLTATCVVAALLHLSHFYYAMGTSLLVKSIVMLALGAALLVIPAKVGMQRK